MVRRFSRVVRRFAWVVGELTLVFHACWYSFARMLETDSKAFLDLSCVCMM